MALMNDTRFYIDGRWVDRPEAPRIAVLKVLDTRPEPGLVDLPHRWHVAPGHTRDGA